jgi:hypothetical protein
MTKPYDVLDFFNQIPEGNDFDFTHEGVQVQMGQQELRLIASTDDDRSDTLRTFAYDLMTMAFSEFTNNDACDVTVRERSAHLSSHDDLPEHVRNGNYVVVDVRIDDYLS